MIYYLIMAVRAVQAKAESGENFEEEYFPLSDVKYVSSTLTFTDTWVIFRPISDGKFEPLPRS